MKNNKKSGGLSPLGSAVTGAAAGAAAVILSDKKNRDAIMDKVQEVKEMGEEKVAEAKKNLDPLMNTGQKKAKKAVKKIRKVSE